DHSSGVLTITLNRPEVFNAFNDDMKTELNDALKDAGKNRAVRCLVITGAGEKAFCSGQDLKEHSEGKRSLRESLEKMYNPMIRKIRTMEKPVIGMINGVAAGAGCSLALACDMRIMSESAKFIEVFIRIGLIPDSGSHWFLTRMVGPGRAFEYAATGRDISADEAMRVGLANRVVPPARLAEETMSLATSLAAAPTRAIGYIKRILNRSASATLDDILDYEAVMQQSASETSDHSEGVKAFIEKRPPRFTGN
ncbi:MAG TPA: enoyl-CoA hydratase-related protein, partial [Bacteroidota bacterium]|nr:enoyl-CoA hydratase-related protein [Bacteroidota bacterium]